MQTILDAPFAAHNFEQALWGSFGSGQTGQPILDFAMHGAGGQSGETAFQFENLPQTGPVQVVIEQTAGGEGALFQTPVGFVDGLGGPEVGGWTAPAWDGFHCGKELLQGLSGR